MKNFHKNKNSINSVVTEILSFKQQKLTTLYVMIFIHCLIPVFVSIYLSIKIYPLLCVLVMQLIVPKVIGTGWTNK